MKRLAILGSTGSIGTSTLDVVRAHRDRFAVAGLAAGRSAEQLLAQAQEFRPAAIGLADAHDGWADVISGGCDALTGPDAATLLAIRDDVDTVVAAIVGAAGLESTLAAIEAGKDVALANKETMVVAGPIVRELLKTAAGSLLPVDSEHSAVLQAMAAEPGHDTGGRSLSKITLTASGGPFRGWTAAQLAEVTPEQALKHPTWDMGAKITIDSATMMNKALEVIEARWLFDLPVEDIDVVVHPQSIVHGMAEFADGSVVAQLSPPDMRLPIQLALTWPERLPGVSPRLDLAAIGQLDFEPPDVEQFPALLLGFEVARRGGTAGAVLNAANEVAVERFLSGSLRFCDIPTACRDVLETHDFDPSPTLEELLRQDTWARKELAQWNA